MFDKRELPKDGSGRISKSQLGEQLRYSEQQLFYVRHRTGAETDPYNGIFQCFFSSERPEKDEFQTGVKTFGPVDRHGSAWPPKGEGVYYFWPGAMMCTEGTRRMLRPWRPESRTPQYYHLIADHTWLHDVVQDHGIVVDPADPAQFTPGYCMLVAIRDNPVGVDWRKCHMAAECCETHGMLTDKLAFFKTRSPSENWGWDKVLVYRLETNVGELPYTLAQRAKQALEFQRIPKGVREVTSSLLCWMQEDAEDYAQNRWREPFCATVQAWVNRLAVSEGGSALPLFSGQPAPTYKAKLCKAQLTMMVKENRKLMGEAGAVKEAQRGAWLMTLVTEDALVRRTAFWVDWWRQVLDLIRGPDGVRLYNPPFRNRKRR